jgi:hypothetical protein
VALAWGATIVGSNRWWQRWTRSSLRRSRGNGRGAHGSVGDRCSSITQAGKEAGSREGFGAVLGELRPCSTLAGSFALSHPSMTTEQEGLSERVLTGLITAEPDRRT